jgi:iron-sulfur cluster repair protein YtfE (RIC family)
MRREETDMTITATPSTQLMLPGQAAAPDGPVDMFVMYLMHHAFRRDLARFSVAVERTPLEDRDTWRALAARWDRFFSILHHHHAGEDAVLWPFLLGRADEQERSHLEAMEEEHGHIDPLLTSVAEGFTSLGGDALPPDAADRRAALLVRVTATRDALGRHLAHEESEAMAILQRHMTAQEWVGLEEKGWKKDNPDPISYVLPWLAEGLAGPELADAFGRGEKAMKVLWWLTRGRFRRGEQRAFRYAG